MCNIASNVGTEELAHLEMVSTIVHQLTKNLSMEEIEESGFANYYVDHTIAIWPQAAGGIPFNSCEFQSKGDAITDLFEDMAAEPAPPTTTSCASSMTATCANPSSSCGQGRLFTSRGLEKRTVLI